MSSVLKRSELPRDPAVKPTRVDGADPTVLRFLDAVWMERGLSPNTLAAYRADLTALTRWLAERDIPIIRTTRGDLLGFIAWHQLFHLLEQMTDDANHCAGQILSLARKEA